MKTIRTLFVSALLMLATATFADSYQYLTVTQTGGETNFTVSSIQKITFDTTDMILHFTDGTTQQLPLSELSKMFFSNNATGIAATNMQSKMQFTDGVLRATVSPGESISLYNMKGEKVFSTNKSGS